MVICVPSGVTEVERRAVKDSGERANAREVYKHTEKNSALKRNGKLEELGNSALFLISDMSKAVTGEIHYVDCGFNIIGMPQD